MHRVPLVGVVTVEIALLVGMVLFIVVMFGLCVREIGLSGTLVVTLVSLAIALIAALLVMAAS